MKKIASTWFLYLLRFFATLQLTKVRPTIVGVTGSAGKSSTVSAIACVLKKQYKVKWTKKGNSETGIPLEILNIPVENFSILGWIRVIVLALYTVLFDWESYDVLVVEMGIDSEQSPKNMEYLLSFIPPTVGVFLNVNAVHAQNFSGEHPVATIAKEKGRLLSALPREGLAIINQEIEDEYHLSSTIQSPLQHFSLKKQHGDIWLEEYSVSVSGTKFVFRDHAKMYELQFPKQLHIRQASGGLMSALLVGQYFTLPFSDSIKQLEQAYKLPKGRMSMIEGIRDSVIIDSSYNSSPSATKGALEVLGNMNGRKIAILGDMRELGSETEKEHQIVGKLAEKYAQEIVFVGPLTKKYSYPILSKSAKEHAHCFDTAYQSVIYLKELVQRGDMILVKGSQNTIFLEIVVKALMKHPDKAKSLLCRQTEFWEQERKKILNT